MRFNAQPSTTPLSLLDATYRLTHQEIVVRRTPPQTVQMMRSSFSKKDRRFFANMAIAEICDDFYGRARDIVLRSILDFESHHIVPLSLDGGKAHANLALVEPKLHDAIHAHIDQQTRHLNNGDRRLITVPYSPRRTWGLAPNVLRSITSTENTPPWRSDLCRHAAMATSLTPLSQDHA